MSPIDSKKIKKTQENDEEMLQIERMILFYKYLVLFFMCESLKKEKISKKKETNKNIKQTKKWFTRDNPILQDYCILAEIDIDKLFEEYELRKKSGKIDNYLRPKFFKMYKNRLTF